MEDNMDLSVITVQNSQSMSDVYNASKMEATPVAKKSEVVQEPVQVPGVNPALFKQVDQKRLHDLEQVVQDPKVRDIYVVGDSRFTIFKDMQGRFITRVTSLRDGTVTYIPEGDIMKFSATHNNYFHVSA
ncbi:MAG: hypothetical protein EAZ74_03180 [Alphaproteobacteria bacterium]|nr:MAG: hypothetical protein EAZ74_03180 [Alphaproteobacteria bacterium]TAF40674.1 MAG: hypothetical protein EAZ66_02600 [Alphaproteobacteria bacterium]TAF76095.1 MAG: hypothetical protein EAZ52_05215 [Alphaproteobacteria bacterium]